VRSLFDGSRVQRVRRDPIRLLAAAISLITIVGLMRTVRSVRVVVDGDSLLEGERANGFMETFQGEDEVLIRVGDAGAVQLVVNGEDQGALGQSGQVVEFVCLSGQVTCEREEIT
jgi:hypothetical protein